MKNLRYMAVVKLVGEYEQKSIRLGETGKS